MQEKVETEDFTINEGRTLSRLVNEEPVKRAFERLEIRHFQAFQAAKTPEAALAAWSNARALVELQIELQATQDRGTIAAAHKNTREGRR